VSVKTASVGPEGVGTVIRSKAPLPAHPRYVLTVEALPDDVPAAVRLRRLLKLLLRGYRFRCVRVAPVRPYGQADAGNQDAEKC